MNLEVEKTGLTKLTTNRLDINDFIGFATAKEIIDLVDAFKIEFGENLEKLHEIHNNYNGKAFLDVVKAGNCRCGSCDDIYEWRWFVNR